MNSQRQGISEYISIDRSKRGLFCPVFLVSSLPKIENRDSELQMEVNVRNHSAACCPHSFGELW